MTLFLFNLIFETTLKSNFYENFIPKSEFWNENNQELTNSKVALWNSFFDF